MEFDAAAFLVGSIIVASGLNGGQRRLIGLMLIIGSLLLSIFKTVISL